VSDVPARWAQSYTIQVYPAAGGAPKVMALSHDAQPSVIGWLPGGKKILFYESKGTGTALFEADVAAGTVRELDYKEAVVNQVNMTKLSDGGYRVALVSQTSDAPPEAFIVTAGNTFKQISSANSDLAKMPVGKTEVIKWKSTDGRDIEGLLTYPVGYTAGTKVPLILNIHGGPAGVFSRTMWAAAVHIRSRRSRRRATRSCVRIRAARVGTERNSAAQISRIGAAVIIRT
jgi:hypothetical protein